MINEASVGVVGGLPWRPERLRTERRVNPPGVGTAHPWLDWRLPAEAADAAPTGYRVRAATSEAGLAEPDAWDSGWVASTARACRPAASSGSSCLPGSPPVQPRPAAVPCPAVRDGVGLLRGASERSGGQ